MKSNYPLFVRFALVILLLLSPSTSQEEPKYTYLCLNRICNYEFVCLDQDEALIQQIEQIHNKPAIADLPVHLSYISQQIDFVHLITYYLEMSNYTLARFFDFCYNFDSIERRMLLAYISKCFSQVVNLLNEVKSTAQGACKDSCRHPQLVCFQCFEESIGLAHYYQQVKFCKNSNQIYLDYHQNQYAILYFLLDKLPS